MKALKYIFFTGMFVLCMSLAASGLAAETCCAQANSENYTIDMPCLILNGKAYKAKMVFDPDVPGGLYWKLDLDSFKQVDTSCYSAGDGQCENSTITLTIDGETETLSLVAFQGFEIGADGLYTCAWHSDSSQDQLLLSGISASTTDGTTYVYSNSDPSHVSLIWNLNAYYPTDFSITFSKWEGAGGIARGTVSATLYNLPLDSTITITDVEFCAPIAD